MPQTANNASRGRHVTGLIFVTFCAIAFSFFRLGAAGPSEAEASLINQMLAPSIIVDDGAVCVKQDESPLFTLLGGGIAAIINAPLFSMRVLSAISGIICLHLVLIWAWRRFGFLVGFLSGLICIASAGWLFYSHTATPEMLGAALYFAYMFSLYGAVAGKAAVRAPRVTLAITFLILLLAAGGRDFIALAYISGILMIFFSYPSATKIRPAGYLVPLVFSIPLAFLLPELLGDIGLSMIVRGKALAIFGLATLPWIFLLPMGVGAAGAGRNVAWDAFFTPVIWQLRQKRWRDAILVGFVLFFPQYIIDRYAGEIVSPVIVGILRLVGLNLAGVLSSLLATGDLSGKTTKDSSPEDTPVERFLVIWLLSPLFLTIAFGMRGVVILAALPPLAMLLAISFQKAISEGTSAPSHDRQKPLFRSAIVMLVALCFMGVAIIFLVRYGDTFVRAVSEYWPGAAMRLPSSLTDYLATYSGMAYACMAWVLAGLLLFLRAVRARQLPGAVILMLLLVASVGYLWITTLSPGAFPGTEFRQRAKNCAEISTNMAAPLGIFITGKDATFAYYAGVETHILKDRKSFDTFFSGEQLVYCAVPAAFFQKLIARKRNATQPYVVWPRGDDGLTVAADESLPVLITNRKPSFLWMRSKKTEE